MRRTSTRGTRIATAALGGMLLLGSGMLAVGATAAPPATTAALGLKATPSSGDSAATAQIDLEADGSCPEEATNVVVTMSQAGFPADTVIVGNNSLEALEGKAIAVVSFSFKDLALTSAVPLPLSGTGTIRLQCIDTFGTQSFQDFSRQITFTPTTGEDSTWQMAPLGDGSPTPSPTGTVTPTPVPSASVSPTPTPSNSATPTPTVSPGEPTPTPSPGEETPTPKPTDDGTAGTDSNSGNGNGSGNGSGSGGLPASGASTQPLLEWAAMLLAIGGGVLLLLAAVPYERPRE